MRSPKQIKHRLLLLHLLEMSYHLHMAKASMLREPSLCSKDLGRLLPELLSQVSEELKAEMRKIRHGHEEVFELPQVVEKWMLEYQDLYSVYEEDPDDLFYRMPFELLREPEFEPDEKKRDHYARCDWRQDLGPLEEEAIPPPANWPPPPPPPPPPQPRKRGRPRKQS